MMSTIKKNWNGQEKLWKVFWIWNVLVPPVIATATFFVFFATVFPVVLMVAFNKSFENISFPQLLVAFLGVLVTLFSVLYSVWAMVSLWRSAFNSSKKFFGYLARGWVIYLVLTLVAAPFSGAIFPASVLNFTDEEMSLDLGEISLEVDQRNAPSDSDWGEIRQGLSKDQVREMLGVSSMEVGVGDEAVWYYWSIEDKDRDDLTVMLRPTGKVFKVYFDKDGKVTDKKTEFVAKE